MTWQWCHIVIVIGSSGIVRGGGVGIEGGVEGGVGIGGVGGVGVGSGMFPFIVGIPLL